MSKTISYNVVILSDEELLNALQNGEKIMIFDIWNKIERYRTGYGDGKSRSEKGWDGTYKLKNSDVYKATILHKNGGPTHFFTTKKYSYRFPVDR